MEFWNQYRESDEIKQREMLKQLTGTHEDKNGFLTTMTLTLFKSYIDDAQQKDGE